MSVVISGIKLLSLSPPTLLSLAQGGNAYTFCDSLLSWELPLSRLRLQPRPTGSDFPFPATERLGGSPRGCADMSEGLWPQIFLESKFKWVGRHCAPTRLRLTNWSVTLPGIYYLSTITWKYSFSFDIITWCEKRNIAPKIVVLSLPCSYLKSVDGSSRNCLIVSPALSGKTLCINFQKCPTVPHFYLLYLSWRRVVSYWWFIFWLCPTLGVLWYFFSPVLFSSPYSIHMLSHSITSSQPIVTQACSQHPNVKNLLNELNV